MTVKELKKLLSTLDESLEIRSTVEEHIDDGEGNCDVMEVDVKLIGVLTYPTIAYINWRKL